MKNLLFLVSIVFLLGACNSNNNSTKDVDAEPIVMEFGVDGMTCGGCVGTVEASVKQMGEGIVSVKANLDSSNAIVEFNPEVVKAKEIKEAIELNGYKITKQEKR